MLLAVDTSPGSTSSSVASAPISSLSSGRIRLAALGLAGNPRGVSYFEATRAVPKSADQHDATAPYGHYRYTVGCEHTIVEAEAAIGEAHRLAQDLRVGAAR